MRLIPWAAVAVAFFAPLAGAAAAPQLKARFTALPVTRSVARPVGQNVTATPLPTFTYSINDGVSGTSYSGTILGGDPLAAIKTSTTLPLQIVPLVVTISGVGVFDPTQPDACNGGLTVTSYVNGSPLLTTRTHWVMNGHPMGRTQYIDAFQRAQFWSKVHGTNYHLLFAPTRLTPQNATFSGSQYTGGCETLGMVSFNDIDALVQNIITGALASKINVGTLPVFLLHNVVMYEGSVGNCCIIGYHGGMIVGGNLQVYSVADVDSTGVFGGLNDVAALSHELGEAVNDPLGNNPTDPWGKIGQVSGCQSNLEDGDPLSGTQLPAITNGTKTYHVQELAFFNWFYHTSPSWGAGGLYSNNGTFTTYAAAC